MDNTGRTDFGIHHYPEYQNFYIEGKIKLYGFIILIVRRLLFIKSGNLLYGT